RLRIIVIEHAMMIAKPPAWIEDDAQRIGPRHQAGCQLRGVHGNGPCADHHRIAQRTKTMEMKDVLLAGHPAGLTGVRRNESVETLPEMTDGNRFGDRRTANRQIEVDQGVPWI